MLNQLKQLFLTPKKVMIVTHSVNDDGEVVSKTNEYSYDVWLKIKQWYIVQVPHTSITLIY